MTSPYLTLKEAAAVAGKHPETLKLWIRKGWLKAGYAGRDIRIRPEVLTQAIDSGRLRGRP